MRRDWDLDRCRLDLTILPLGDFQQIKSFRAPGAFGASTLDRTQSPRQGVAAAPLWLLGLNHSANSVIHAAQIGVGRACSLTASRVSPIRASTVRVANAGQPHRLQKSVIVFMVSASSTFMPSVARLRQCYSCLNVPSRRSPPGSDLGSVQARGPFVVGARICR